MRRPHNLGDVRAPDTLGSIGFQFRDETSGELVEFASATVTFYDVATGASVEMACSVATPTQPTWRHAWGGSDLPTPSRPTTYVGKFQGVQADTSRVVTTARCFQLTALPENPLADRME